MSKLRIIELVVFILVLGIAWVITFMSFSASSKESRDATRAADLIKISDGLKLYATSAGKYPLPDEWVEVKAWTASIIQQGYAGDWVFASITQTSVKDPLGDNNFKYLNYYTYSTNAEQKQFQLMAFLEQWEQVKYSPLAQRTPVSIGDDVGILLENETQRPIQETKMGVNVLQTSKAYVIYIWKKTILKWNALVLKHILAISPKSRSKSCLELHNAGFFKNGYFYINPLIWLSYASYGKTIKVFCEMESSGGGWTRLYYKNGKETCKNDGVIYNQYILQTLLTKDFAVSDKLESLNSEGSWILKNINITQPDFDFAKLANVSNCKTPNWQEWSMTFFWDFLYLSWKLSTLWNWKSMFYGCKEYKNIWDNVKFRIGWHERHPWEFIHGNCSNSSNIDNSITSRWDWDNTRVIWVR